MLTRPLKLLREYFGYQQFRAGQPELISAIISGRDALGIMPTGAGKSLCFQIPALMAEGTVIVVSPLISLMKDQVEALREAGLPAAFINSTLTVSEYKNVVSQALSGTYKLIYVAPERLENPSFLNILNRIRVGMVTIDEAHCVSQWGHDFRPSYLKIAEMINKFEKRPVVSAFTATATPAVRDDIVKLLELDAPVTVVTGFDRKNLYFEVNRPDNKLEFTLGYLRKNAGKCGIIYCITRKLVESVHEKLKSRGIAAVKYHAGLTLAERKAAQEDFIYDRAEIIVATNAFGMGIDKSNVRFVLHYNMPKNIESYYQEAGRAGRDGEKSECVLLFSGSDVIMNKFLIENGDRDKAAAGGPKSDKSLELQKLSQMIEYCAASSCLRNYVLRYFGERPDAGKCGGCGNCMGNSGFADMTERAKKVLACVDSMGGRFGSTFVAEILRGENPERAGGYGFDRLPSYGALKEIPAPAIKDLISSLAADGYLKIDDSVYRTLALSEKGAGALKSEDKILSRLKMAAAGTKAPAKMKPASETGGSAELFDRLRALRRELAEKRHVPPYLIFSDAALNGMCKTLPSTNAQFLEVSGVGQCKLKQYGKIFMAEIARFASEKRL